MFEYVSGANFFGEILEWTGFAVACWSLEVRRRGRSIVGGEPAGLECSCSLLLFLPPFPRACGIVDEQGAVFAVFTFCNIAPRGAQHHKYVCAEQRLAASCCCCPPCRSHDSSCALFCPTRWYQQKFEDYPKSRRAVIPFVW